MEKTEKDKKLLNTLIDYELRGNLLKWLSPIRLFPRYAAMYYTWKAKTKLSRWKASKGKA